MPGIRDVKGLEPVYFDSGQVILKSFLLPVLAESVEYDRITGYFTVEALLAVAQGLDHLYECGGRMRLAVGIHDFPRDAAEAVAERKDLSARIGEIRSEIVRGLAKLSDSLLKDRLATLALMIEDGFLEVKAVDTVKEGGIFHSKVLIMRDDAGDCVAAMGSLNETASGLGDNFENLVVLRSWVDETGVSQQQAYFEQMWAGQHHNLVVMDLTKELAQDIVDGLGAEYVNHVRLRLKQCADIHDAQKMPAYFFVSGVIPALYQHQERAVIDGLSRWPVRVLYADEVGLGKTFEVAATIAYLVRFCGVNRVVILTPKSVLTQWQEELHDNFCIDAWFYDSPAKVYVSPQGVKRPVRDNCPLGADMPSVALISAQYARGSQSQNDIFTRPGAVMPDVLAVDEAHAARVSLDIGGKRKATKFYQVLRDVAPKVPHLILATATPMQKDALEYHSLLNLLGLPGPWSREKAFDLSLSIVASSDPPALNELAQGARLLQEVVDGMRPQLSMLDDEERGLLEKLDSLSDSIHRGLLVSSNWDVFKRLLIKLHPARLLTVRNTRRALEEIGYIFPKRELEAQTLYGHDCVIKFYKDVEHYIGSTYLGVEKVLYPDKVFSDGFVKSGYQQRMASSLYSCGESLKRRKAKLETLRTTVMQTERQAEWTIETDLIDEDEDDALFEGKEQAEYLKALSDVDPSQVLLALNTEIADITPLLKRLNGLLDSDGDPKVDTAVTTALEHIDKGDKVLIFSRYTDTVDAVLVRWKQVAPQTIGYGVYTGSGAVVCENGFTRATTKEEIKSLLNASRIEVMFCSDAASEGLNLQAARVLINVDVPWTPARLEQRIGRVARLGQKAPSVEIINIWYPQSVEHRMYTRINQRLKGYNLAIGEFPEVVAATIRQSILDANAVDESVQLLQEIRNSLQTKALQSLWVQDGSLQSSSRVFRQQLVKDIASRAHCEWVDGQALRVERAGEDPEVVTSSEGERETVSLSSRCVLECFPVIQGCRTATDKDGRACAFVCGDDVIDPEVLPAVLMGKAVPNAQKGPERPKWVPDVAAMGLQYAVEYQPPMPHIWPPKMGDE